VSVLLLRSQDQRLHLNREALTTRKFSRKSRLVNVSLFTGVPRDQKGILVHQEETVHQGGPVHREVLDPKALPALKVLLDPRALQGARNVTGSNVFIMWLKVKTRA